ncbi:flavin-dependent oxidoreductase [Ramlibacter tataouinensis]|uniref:Salicylate hydroxylase (Salicylate 1-monooxygenase)-like protein n=1 Tax=Ramlibacter tataouinensis (strain ATCC BAA-407 / DSM 14655 / LMG 21543 / TTB310) TaxID=365046 RepID=F5Y190_RAMTT|nr:flavin-dependent oxidoreductase [Ramlibacter tataouinensis]AEG93491.1 salicylate hydroxylase (Salicylate 1-monooxygenase)-like protein [Ramlibacter tataouinensis TTB310]
MNIAIVGGGIGGLSLALALHQRGIACEVYEQAGEIREVGVGITLLPHAMRELAALGVQAELETQGIENLESVFYNRWGQFIYREPRGRHAGYALPELGMHRGKLHRVLYDAVLRRLGAGGVHLDHRFGGLAQDETGVSLQFQDGAGRPRPAVRADAVIACDGVNSAVRRLFYPDERMAFTGINTWRGVTVHRPILSGRSYLRIGTVDTGKMVVYPIVDDVDGQGNQLVNWVAEIRQDPAAMNDWNRPGRLEDFLPFFAGWRFDWLDVPALIEGAQQVFEYPMVDKDPVPRWTFGRVTLLGDAAHPMYPRGSNGSAQAIIDAAALAEALVQGGGVPAALQAYERRRLEPTARVVQTNRTVPPDFIIMKADELSGGRPFEGSIDNLISPEELRRISDEYKQVAGFALMQVQARGAVSAGS